MNTQPVEVLRELAVELGYTLTGTTKAEIVAEILAAQTAEIEEEADEDESGDYSQEELEALTIAQIKVIAADKGYTITATRKADIITEFLAAQEAAGSDAE